MTMWSIISGGKPRHFATEDRARKALDRIGGYLEQVSPQPASVGQDVGASTLRVSTQPSAEAPKPSFKGESMTAETDKLSSAASSFATFTAKVGRVADKLNDKIIAADKMVDHIDAKADEVGNFHAELTRIMGQFSNMPPS